MTAPLGPMTPTISVPGGGVGEGDRGRETENGGSVNWAVMRPTLLYRVGNARERTTGGVGLGLTIDDRTIRLHGGTVRAANAPDGGLVVELSLPGARPEPATPAPLESARPA